MTISASIIIVTYDHKKYLDPCIKSILKQDYSYEIIIVDNNSNDNTYEYIKKNYPEIKLIKNKQNYGYGKGNNIGVKHAQGEYIVILNPDTIVENDWLNELIKPLKNNKKIITTPKILLYDGKAINTCGNINHFTGLTFTRGLNENLDKYNTQERVSGISGCNFAIKKSYYEELGSFDENFYMYNEDSDFSWRAYLKGFEILFIPTSKIRHDYNLKVTAKKIYHLEKGRYMILKKYLSMKDFIVLFPSFFITELLTLGYTLKIGKCAMQSKYQAIKDVLKIKVSKNKGSDRSNLFKSLNSSIPIDQLSTKNYEKIVKNICNKIYNLNFNAYL